jgi:hypothetical protein
MVLVKDGVRDGIEVEAGGVTEDQALKDRRQEDDETAARIFQNSEKFLPDQRQDAKKRGFHSAISGKLFARDQPR